MRESPICDFGLAIDDCLAVQDREPKIEVQGSERRHSAQSLLIRIADITIGLRSSDPELKLTVAKEMTDFLVDGGEPDVNLRAAWSDLGALNPDDRVFDSGGPWQLYRHEDGYVFCFTSPSLGPLPYKVARFDRELMTGEVYLQRDYFDHEQPIYPLEYPLDELLIAHLLGKSRGVEVHALGLADPEGNGLLFLGQSGAGKTTTARLWQQEKGVTILSDDRIILRKVGGTFWMYGTPWHGEAELACPTQVPLTQVFFLRQRPKNELVSVRENEAVGRMFACSFPAFYDAQALDFTLGFLGEVVQEVPCDELGFLPDGSAVEFIQGKTAVR